MIDQGCAVEQVEKVQEESEHKDDLYCALLKSASPSPGSIPCRYACLRQMASMIMSRYEGGQECRQLGVDLSLTEDLGVRSS